MDTQISMKPSNFTNFLEHGALLRRGPNDWLLLEGPFSAKVTKDPAEVALYHPDFFEECSSPYWIPESFYRLTDEQVRGLCQGKDVSPPSKLLWKEAQLSHFEASFAAILERIQQGSLKKAVPIVFEKSTESVSSSHLISMLCSLLHAPSNLFVFGFWQKGKGILGATPEILLRQSGAHLHTMALAGTCPKEDARQRVSLLEDPKECHEHDLVVQDILQSLKKYGPLKTQGPQILELPTLFHLKTEIECQVSDMSSFDFFKVCKELHPTPALGISPRTYGHQWMKELPEQKERGGFGAPWGLQWSADEALCLVAIRNIQWSEEGSRIGSGCGVVAQSDLQQEWRELFQKRQSVKKVLGLNV